CASNNLPLVGYYSPTAHLLHMRLFSGGVPIPLSRRTLPAAGACPTKRRRTRQKVPWPQSCSSANGTSPEELLYCCRPDGTRLCWTTRQESNWNRKSPQTR